MNLTSLYVLLRTYVRDWRWRLRHRRRTRALWLPRFWSKRDWSAFLSTGLFRFENGWALAPSEWRANNENVCDIIGDDPAEVAKWRAYLDRALSEAEKQRSTVWRYLVNFEDDARWRGVQNGEHAWR